MEWLIGFLLLLVGLVIGFFGARFVNTQETVAEDIPGEQTIKELMAQHANSHIIETKRIAQLLEQQTLALNQQVEEFEQIISADSSNTEDLGLSYFGEHASVYLRNKGAKQSRAKSTASVQPLDFSSHSSGLFSGDGSSKVSGKE
ncbi:MAG: uncharacterized membrane-anchored protein YhcB (DUF1043 family) [Paraglaciecola sp.]|jgi:uncharacterized membrane-anchored protein YhcB (DUF1043 family)